EGARDLRDHLALRLGPARRPAEAAAPRLGAGAARRRAGHEGDRGGREGRRVSYCGSMPASLISLPQFTSSDCTNAASDSGGPENASKPVMAMRAFASGFAMIFCTSAFKRSTISFGVPAGANNAA